MKALFLLIILMSYSLVFATNNSQNQTLNVYRKGKSIQWKSGKGKNKFETDIVMDAFAGGGYDEWDFQSAMETDVFVIEPTSVLKMNRRVCDGTDEGALCHNFVRFTPSTSGVFFATVGEFFPRSGEYIYYEVTGVAPEEIEPCDCPDLSNGSIIRNDDQSVSEMIPILGTDFSLFHSSQFAPEYVTSFPTTGRIDSFNPEGWALSIVHHYKSDSNNLFLATGQKIKNKSLQSDDGTFQVVYNDEVFVFNSEGTHLRTRSILTGFEKYSFAYNYQNKLIKVTDAFQKDTVLTRDMAGNLLSITAPYGQITTISLNDRNLIESVSNQNTETFQIQYAQEAELISSFTRPSGNTTNLKYTYSARLEQDEGQGGNSWSFENEYYNNERYNTRYSTMGRSTVYKSDRQNGIYVRSTIFPSGLVTQYHEGEDKSQVSSDLFSTVSTFTMPDERFGDRLPRVWKVTETIDELTKTTEISKVVDLTDLSDPFSFSTIQTITKVNGVDSTNVFNKTTRKSETTNEMGVKTLVELDEFERPVLIQHASDIPLSLSYNSQGQIIQSTQGGKNTKNYTYGQNGEVATITNGLNHQVAFEYDEAERVSKLTYADGRFTAYSYNQDGLLTSITPPGREAHAFTLNAFDLPESYFPPSLPEVGSTQTHYSYNLDKQLTKVLRPDGKEVNYNYHETTGLLEQMNLGSEEVQIYSYYPNTENIQTINSSDGVQSLFTYFGKDTISSEQQILSDVSSKVEFSFDNFFREIRRKVHYNGAEVSATDLTYRLDGQLSKVGDLLLTYEENSGRLGQTTLEKIRDFKSYDSYGNLKSYRAGYYPSTKCRSNENISGCAKELYSYSLTRDALHRIVTKIEKIQGTVTSYEYSYDSSGRLASVTKDGVISSSFSYDENSNRVSGTQNSQQFSATFDSQDRQLTYSLGTGPVSNFNYNANGELIEVARGDEVTSFTSDSLGRLKSVTLPSLKEINYLLDWEGRRIEKKVDNVSRSRSIFEDFYRLAADINLESDEIKEYVFATNINSADYMIVGPSHYRIIKDHLGSPRLVVNASNGQVIQRMDYNEWGEVTLDTNPGFQAFGFAGGLYDPDTKLVKFGARDYDGRIGRWLSKDPIRFEGGDYNLFGYVLNDPVNFMDPEGEQRQVIGMDPYSISSIKPGSMGGLGGAAGASALGMCLKDAFSKGGKQNIGESDLKNLSAEELQNRIKTSDGKEKRRLQKQQKFIKIRNKKKRE